MNDIFLSYASADRGRAEVIANLFSEQGWTVWWDRTIPPGKSFDEVIEEAIDSATCIVVLWSNTSIASDWVKTEAAEGVRRKSLIPILIDEVKIPLEFRRIQAANLIASDISSTNPELAKLLKAVSSITGKPPKSVKHPNAEFKTEEKPYTKMAQPKARKNAVSQQPKQTTPDQTSSTRTTSSATRFKVLIIVQIAIIWIVLLVYLFNDFFSSYAIFDFMTSTFVFLPIFTGIWLAIASRSAGFQYGVILGLTTIIGYAFSWVCLNFITGNAFTVIGPTLFGIAVIPVGYISLLRLRNVD